MSIFTKNTPFFVFLIVLGIRLQNALTISAFFQPDEYFQSLEIAASQHATGSGYITWEWHHALRSVLYPRIFQGVYGLVDSISKALNLSPATTAELLVVGPKIVGAITAALGDVYTGLLARKIYGKEAGTHALLLSLFSAWNWFCSTRTFSNNLETTLTIMGMYYWPWKTYNPKDLTLASIFAAISFTVRPTNGLITWAIGPLLLQHLPTLPQRLLAILQILLISITILSLNACIDYTFYNRPTLPFIEFYRLNISQSISSFYGTSPWHYYYSQGLPLLLTGYLPLAIYSFLGGLNDPSSYSPTTHLTRLLGLVPIAFMATKHKEVRFLYPLLPIFHVLMAGVGVPGLPRRGTRKWTLVVAVVLGVNIPIAYYTGYVHQRGVVDVVNWLRREHYSSNNNSGDAAMIKDVGGGGARVGFLMPCHSTPFGSYMWDAGMKDGSPSAWFLTCEPPVGVPIDQREDYVDEADEFYNNPTDFLYRRFGRPPLKRDRQEGEEENDGENSEGKMLWPDKLITFEATAELIRGYLRIERVEGRYVECKRFFNSHFHDDWRRKGDVIVWCLK
ncbi:glycosylphosphatidylinositol anchor biosynthesis [Orbilia oligospora]|uniref:Mannosyltransferase n=1 Tax=Orbilia oligospora TaxID=2813651 RepID=A0A6G1MAC4_ORBOL|nr:glycosylphosphatidylinositol anchor biosynthesis [Orbilia oligospora]KAF3249085.1 glycosylphosphatidylinositol anchor biosynthesis [Orbilia oligospora]